MNKIKHFLYWLPRYLRAVFFNKVGLLPDSRWDWMTWKQYKQMTDNLTKSLSPKE